MSGFVTLRLSVVIYFFIYQQAILLEQRLSYLNLLEPIFIQY